MYARVVRVTGDPAKVDDGIDAYQARVPSALRELDGYAGARLMVNRETGTGMSISFWQDEQTLRASDSAISGVRDETVSRFGATTPASENYEAAVQHRPQPTEQGNWVRVTSLEGDPAKVDDSIRHFESEVIPAISQLQGFRGAVLFVDRATGKGIVGTIWNSKQDVEATASQAAPIRASAAEVIGATNPQVETFEVVFAEALSPAER